MKVNDLIKVLKGTASDEDVDELVTILSDYMGQYDGVRLSITFTSDSELIYLTLY